MLRLRFAAGCILDMEKRLSDRDNLGQEIIEALKAENWSGALRRLQVWCDRFPNDPLSWFNRGLCLVRLGRHPEAVDCLERCLELDSGLVKARKLLDFIQVRRAKDGPAGVDAPQRNNDRQAAETAVEARSQAFSTPTSGRSEWRKGLVMAGRYEVREVVSGGMGAVYLAYDRELQRMVAVKTPLPAVLASADGCARFFREAEAWIALGAHPNICTAYYVQEIGGLPRLFIEYVDGGDLDCWLKDGRQLDFEVRLDIAIQIARGLHYTNTLEWTDEAGVRHCGLIHRDLKPANVLLTTDGAARVTDFGLVRAEAGSGSLGPQDATAPPSGLGKVAGAVQERVVSAGLADTWRTVTMAGGVVGTPPYVAPEIWKGAKGSGILSDIYSYGCMLYELICGRRPFSMSEELSRSNQQTQLCEWLRLHLNVEPSAPSQLFPGIDPDLESILLSCLAKDPAVRPRSFAVVRDVLTTLYARTFGKPFPRPEPPAAQLLADSLNNRAVSFMTLGQARRAERVLRRARAIDPYHREATFNLALFEWQSKGLTDAEIVRRVEEAGRSRSRSWRDHHLMGRLHLFLGDLGRAAASLRHATESDEASLDAHRDLGLALVGLARAGSGEDQIDLAESSFRKILAAASEDVIGAAGLAACLYRQDRREEADQAWTEARADAVDLPADCVQAFRLFLPEYERRLAIEQPAAVEALAAAGNQQMVCRCSTGISTLSIETGRRTSSIKAPGPAKRGCSLAVTPGGKRMVVTGEDVSLVVWDLERIKQLGECDSQPGYVTAVAVSRDGMLALTGGSDRTLRLWDLGNNSCTAAFPGHQAWVSAAAFLPDGSFAVSAGGDGEIRIWNLETGECAKAFSGHNGQVTRIAVTADGQLMATSGQDGLIQVWEPIPGRLMHSLKGHQGRVTALVVRQAEGLLLSGGEDGTVRYWSLDRGSAQRILRFDHPVSDLAVSDDGRYAGVGHGKIVDLIDLTVIRERRLPFALTVPVTAQESARRQQRFSQQLQTASQSLETGELVDAALALQEARSVQGYAQHPEARTLSGKLLELCPRRTLHSIGEEQSYELGGGAPVIAILTPDEKHAAVATSSGEIQLLELASGRTRGACRGHTTAVAALAVNPEQTLLLAATRDGALHLWRLATGEHQRPPAQLRQSVMTATFTALGDAVIVAGSDGAIMVWSIDGNDPPATLGRHREAVAAVATSADGRIMASGGWDHQVTLWELGRGVKLNTLEGHEGAVLAVTISPDCRLVASAGRDRAVKLWDAASGRCMRTFSEPKSEVSCVVFSQDARFLISGEKSGKLRIWDLHDAASLRVLEGHTAGITGVSLSRDGRQALTSGGDGVIRLWYLDWEPDLREPRSWEARARPFLEVFLRRRAGVSPDKDEPPSWSRSDVERLIRGLAVRGCGRLEYDQVENQLITIRKGWRERLATEEQVVREQQQRQLRKRRVEPLTRVTTRLTRNLGLKLIIGTGVLLLVALIIRSLQVPGSDSVEFNNQMRMLLRKAHVEESATRKTPGLVFAFREKPEVFMSESPSECLAGELFSYVDMVVKPENQATDEIDPHSDQELLQRYGTAIVCLPQVADQRAVSALIEGFRSDLPPERAQDLVTVLVQIGDPAVPLLAQALSSRVPQVRNCAAWALAEMRSQTSIGALVEAMGGDDLTIVNSASTMLQEVITTGILSPAQAFDLISTLSASIDPEIRRNAIYGLATFRASRPVRELLDTAAEDSELIVREAAATTRAQITTQAGG
jgi:WD40 repeat protein/serine/threonine protein kinase